MKKFSSILISLIFTLSSSVYADLVVVDDHRGLQRNPEADKIADGAHSKFANVYIKDKNINVIKGRDRLNSTANSDPAVNMFCYYEAVETTAGSGTDTTDAGTGTPFTNEAGASPTLAFDDNNSTVWESNTGDNQAHIGYDFGSGNTIIVADYSIRASSDGGQTDAAPKDFTLEGSNDDVVYQTLDTQSGEVSWGTSEKRTFSSGNTNAYRYYRIDVTDTSRVTNQKVIIAEIELFLGSSIDSGNLVKKLIVKESDEVVTYDIDGTNRTQIASSLTNEKADCTQIRGTFYFNSSSDGLYKWEGTGSATAIAGVGTPSTPSAAASSNAGGMTSGIDRLVGCAATGTGTVSTSTNTSTYRYKTVFYNNLWGIESQPSAETSTTLSGASSIVSSCSAGVGSAFAQGKQTSATVTMNCSPTDPFNTCRVYRSVANGEEYFLVGETSGSTLNDGKPDIALSDTLDTTIDTISPPSFRYLESYKGSLFTAEGNEIRFNHVPVEAFTDMDTYWLETDQLQISAAEGNIRGMITAGDSLIVCTDKNIYEITGFGVDSFQLKQLVKGVGCASDKSMVLDSQGDVILFDGIQGVYKVRTFDQPTDELTGASIESPRVTLVRISSPNLDDVFRGTDDEISLNPSNYEDSHAYYDFDNDLYFLFIGDNAFIFDNVNQTWSHISATNMLASLYRRTANQTGQGVLVDNVGFFYDNWAGYEMGIESGTVTGTPTSSTSTTLTDTTATFNTTGDGLKGLWIFVDNENGEYRQISSNTATVITVMDDWTTNPITSDDYYIAYIIPDFETKQYQFDKAPRETNMMSLWVIHDKADSTQDLEFFTFENKSTTPSRQLSGVIDLSDTGSHFNGFADKVGSRLRSPWVQWGFRSFVYNTSDTISVPVDITSYAFEFQIEEER